MVEIALLLLTRFEFARGQIVKLVNMRDPAEQVPQTWLELRGCIYNQQTWPNANEQ